MKTLVALGLLSACLQLTAAAYFPLNATAVRRVLEQAMRCQSLPQLHAAVVHANDEIYSVKLEMLPSGEIRDIADTRLLYLASVSKGMFGTGLVRVEQHLRTVLKNESFSLFNTPIKQLIGDDNFWFINHGLTEMVTIDDMLSHRTGLNRHDAMWYLNEWQSKEDLARHVGRLKTASEYRGSFVYNNLVFTIADVAVQRLTNRSFVQYMREFLWQPLGMTDTHGSSEMKQKRLLERVDVNRHHRPLGLPLEMSKMEHATRFVEAAGGILASLSDMTRYMRLHAVANHSAYQPAPGQFKPLNAFAAGAGMNGLFKPALYNSSVVSDLPDWEIESYGRGWMRTWHRRHLDYSHGGSLLGVRCELDIFPSQNLAVFNHMTMGPPTDAPWQVAYAAIINKYISELLLLNQSFVTEANVCELFNKIPIDRSVETMQIRKLSSAEVDLLSGSYGNYGFGQVGLSYNQTAGSMTFVFGIAKIELIPVRLRADAEPYHFFLNLLEPQESSNPGNVLNRTTDAITVPRAIWLAPTSFATIKRDAANTNQWVMQAAALESEMLLMKGLDPSSWTRPKLCPDAPPKSSTQTAPSPLGAISLAVAAAAVIVLQ